MDPHKLPLSLETAKRYRTHIAVALYALAAMLLVFFHEPWRDEYQSLMIVRESGSLSDLLWRSRYEGHPAAWYIILYALKPLGHDVFFAQLVHVLIMTATAWLILRHVPMAFAWRVAIVFGYFFLYEYTVFFRNYALTMLLLVGILALLTRPPAPRMVPAAILLALLPHVSIYSLFVAVALALVMLWCVVDKPGLISRIKLVALVLLFAVSCVLAYLQIRQPSDTDFYAGFLFSKLSFLRALGFTWDTFLPIPDLSPAFWGKNVLNGLLDDFHINIVSAVKLLPSLVLWLFAVAALRGSKYALTFFLLLSGMVIALTTTKYFGSIRHHGFVFVGFLAAMWIAHAMPSNVPALLQGRFMDALAARRMAFLKVVLVTQVAAAVVAAWFELRYDFSAGYHVAEYLEEHGLEDRFIVADRDYCTSVVAGVMERPLYYASSGKLATYLEWDAIRRDSMPVEALLDTFTLVLLREPDALLLTSEPLPEEELIRLGLQELEHFGPAIRNDEVFWLYAPEAQVPTPEEEEFSLLGPEP